MGTRRGGELTRSRCGRRQRHVLAGRHPPDELEQGVDDVGRRVVLALLQLPHHALVQAVVIAAMQHNV